MAESFDPFLPPESADEAKTRVSIGSASGLEGHRFAEKYCRRQRIPREQFLISILRKALHLHVRPIHSLLEEIWPRLFEPDYDFIEAIGRARDYEDCRAALREFAIYETNQGFLRGRLRLRLSTRRMKGLIRPIYAQKILVLPEGEDEPG